MNSNWAEENLQTIRTLMERSALYRRALAPIMLYAGMVGTLAAMTALIFKMNAAGPFLTLWLCAAAIVIGGAFFIVRRQAFKEGEPIWSPPTRRVVQALLPPFTVGAFFTMLIALGETPKAHLDMTLPIVWSILYGCALHSAGFFISRGVKWFGWLYIIVACGIILTWYFLRYYQFNDEFFFILRLSPNWFMGLFFGALHLIYGGYLYLTEKGKNAA